MTAFLFQATADHYPLGVTPSPGSTIWWRAQRYRSLMRPGILVFFWQAGGEAVRGLHGWGRVISEPYRHGDDFRVDVSFDCRIKPHVPASVIRSEPILRDHPIFTVRVGSNFLLDENEVMAITALIPVAMRPELASA